MDQLGAMPNTKLGVHPQQVKFVGPPFKTDDVLNIVKEVGQSQRQGIDGLDSDQGQPAIGRDKAARVR